MGVRSVQGSGAGLSTAAAPRPPMAAGIPALRCRTARTLVAFGLAGVSVGTILIGLLHLLGPGAAISPISRTISEYALTSAAWAFNTAVLTLAAGSAAVFAAAFLAVPVSRRDPWLGAGLLLGAVWVAGLLTVVLFPKHNWAVGPSAGGNIHRAASLLAFVALPLAVLLLTSPWLRTALPGRGASRLAGALAVTSLLWFVPLVWAILAAPQDWWRRIPLGLVERGMALAAVFAIGALACWAAVAAGAGAPPSEAPPSETPPAEAARPPGTVTPVRAVSAAGTVPPVGRGWPAER